MYWITHIGIVLVFWRADYSGEAADDKKDDLTKIEHYIFLCKEKTHSNGVGF